MVSVGVVARRAKRSAASVIETRFTEALRRTRSGATRQPRRFQSYPLRLCRKCAKRILPISFLMASIRSTFRDERIEDGYFSLARIPGEDRKGQTARFAFSVSPKRECSTRSRQFVDRVPFQLGNANIEDRFLVSRVR